ncbi:DNA helicase RecQ [Sutterella faecalis]|uniref:DNA helicase RecQ n=2 Tax=Sutterella TaxID=40544 RepID=A0AAI9SEZ0_9BURK|nr:MULTISPECIES: DNA helicase RecQ [Sutterella]KAB7652571.1 DNA helicase RecQ [Sutterella seckii]QDA54942.1 DNA helicase RecQ [Sutterella faecalis]
MRRYSSALEALQQVFGYDSFRGFQKEVVETVVSGEDALVLMPTGGGKSLCYQIPALLRDGVAIVVSPLIALMHDQVDALEELGVRAAYLNSTLLPEEAVEVRNQVRRGEIDLLYVSPERLLMSSMLSFLKELRISLFAIDEAHCVSIWGHDFRPEYSKLSILKETFPQVPRIALTATADQKTREEIVEKLLLNPRKFIASFDRPNIFYRIVDKHNVKEQVAHFIRTEHPGECGVVYCLARSTCEDVCDFLQERGVRAVFYHAGLTAEERAARLALFQREDDVVMVATIAFGMGIDKPNVRFVAHVDMPKSIEGYFQETGRAGRDGLPSDAWMAYGLRDVVSQRRFIEQSDADELYKQLSTQKLDAMLGLAEACDCRRVRLLAYFGEKSEPCGKCDNCVNPPKIWDATLAAKKLISCIWRIQQKSGTSFGAKHVIDVLVGKETERVLSCGHNALSTWGIGKDLNDQQWRAVLRQLIARHVVWVDAERHNVLRLGQLANNLLRGEIQVEVRREVIDQPEGKSHRAQAKASRDEILAGLGGSARQIFEALRKWRLETARALNKPPYVIFPDRTLAEIARRKPVTLDAMLGIPGVGRRKLESYAEEIIKIVRAEY